MATTVVPATCAVVVVVDPSGTEVELEVELVGVVDDVELVGVVVLVVASVVVGACVDVVVGFSVVVVVELVVVVDSDVVVELDVVEVDVGVVLGRIGRGAVRRR
ncbi:MAG TPA: hypothetical protein PLS63_11000, partial [Microthrixaceae bacterium]|nr:hypothetical protein [Microthrixaceae bacterium]